MIFFKQLSQLLVRLRYPVSMPEDVASDLGLSINHSFNNSLNFQEFINRLIDPTFYPTKLTRFMPRQQAEEIFRLAKRKEQFKQNTLISYHFKGGWMEFNLQFDEQSRLRRLYICHKDLKMRREIPIPSVLPLSSMTPKNCKVEIPRNFLKNSF